MTGHGTPRLTPEQVAALAPAKRRQPERAALKPIDQLFTLHGWRIDRPVEDITRGIPGLPDRLYTSPAGLQLWVEGKRPATKKNPRGRVRPAQKRWLAEMRCRDVPGLVADNVGDRRLHEIARLAPGPADYELVLDLCDDVMAEYKWWPKEGGDPCRKRTL